MVAASLVSTQSRVESPFIIVTIGDCTFGHCTFKEKKETLKSILKVQFPNYIQGIDITKVNGAINTYAIRMIYGITQHDDPNMLERVFSSVSESRKLTLSYGDWNAPGYIYKDEEAMITKISSSVDFKNSQILYTNTCTSTALTLKAGTHSFSARTDKPSNIIMELILNERYGLKTIFKGMAKKERLASLIATDDKVVTIQAQPSMNVLDYISYLVSCMVSQSDPETNGKKKSNYYWCVYDDFNNAYGGSYFKVMKVTSQTPYSNLLNAYEVDVGYPSSNYISAFSIKNDETWAILYNYADKIEQPTYTYHINDEGFIETKYSPNITKSSTYFTTTESSKTWWTQMTQYPISASLTIKGLLRPAILMSYVKINTFFYGHKHISSGLYIITKQQDKIDSSGYSTTLTLTRVGGEIIQNTLVGV
jgi:hypothetical protein